jgi:hypothetical protein
VAVVYLFARDIGGEAAARVAGVLAALNPLSIYYAQEARNYAQLATLLILSSWVLWRWMDQRSRQPVNAARYALTYGFLALCAVYTHFLSVFFLVAQGLFAIVQFFRDRRYRSAAAYVGVGAATFVLFIPWIVFSLSQRGQLHSEANLGWIGAPPFSEYFSFLNNEYFWGFTWGHSNTRIPTQWNRWQILTLAFPLLVAALAALRLIRGRGRLAAGGMVYLVWIIAGPVALVALTGHLYHPLYVRPRFALLTVAPFLVLAGIACSTPRRVTWVCVSAGLLAAMMGIGTVTQLRTAQKFDWRKVAKQWPGQTTPSAMVFFPWYAASQYSYYGAQTFTSASKEDIEALMPHLGDSEIWIIKPSWYRFANTPWEREYYHWLIGLGASRLIPLVPDIQIRAVSTQGSAVGQELLERFDQWYIPVDVPEQVGGFEDGDGFHALEYDEEQKPFRWSKPESLIVLFDVTQEDTVTLCADLMPTEDAATARFIEIFAFRQENAESFRESGPVLTENPCPLGPREFSFSAPAGVGVLFVFLRTNCVNPARAGQSNDDRDLGLGLRWMGIKKASLIAEPELLTGT